MATCGLYPIIQFFNSSGAVNAGGSVYTYLTGTTTPKTAYTTQAGSVAHANPIQLDSNGRPSVSSTVTPIWLSTDAEYTLKVMDSLGALLYTLDNVSGILDPLADGFTHNNIKFATAKGILDTSGNEQLLFTKTTNAVNYINITNSATGNAVTLGSAGDDTNVDINITSKGSGAVKINGVPISGSAFRNYKTGHILTYNSTTALNITAGCCSNSTSAVLMNSTSTMTKSINSTWSAGTGNGGLASGVSYTTSTWYHVFCIMDTSGTVDFGFDTSLTASNLLSGSSYTYYRRIGSIKTDGSSLITKFFQHGDVFRWDVIKQDAGSTNPGTSAVTFTLSVPSGVQIEGHVEFSISQASSAATVYGLVTSPEQTDTTPSSSGYDILSNILGSMAMRCTPVTNTSSQIRYRISASSANIAIAVNTVGWRDFF